MTVLKCQRKRGDDLVSAIHQAVFEELVANGIEGFTFESVAHRAGTGKASIYRRWSSRDELIVDSIRAHTQRIADSAPPTFNSLRDELIFMFTSVAVQLNSEFGVVVREIVSEIHRHDGFAELVRDFIVKDRDVRIATAINNAVARGEIHAAELTQAQIELGPALITQRFFIYGSAPDEAFITHIVDDLLLPTFTRMPVAK
jgi:AcrR family transcriptional regulator